MATTRREVVVGGLGLLAVGACGDGSATDATGDTGAGTPDPTAECAGSAIEPKQATLCLGDYPALKKVDGSTVISTSQGRLIVVRTHDDKVVCLSDVCTHQGCAVAWRRSSGSLYCGCHGSEFDARGNVLHGPARSPLQSWPTTFDGATVTVDLG